MLYYPTRPRLTPSPVIDMAMSADPSPSSFETDRLDFFACMLMSPSCHHVSTCQLLNCKKPSHRTDTDDVPDVYLHFLLLKTTVPDLYSVSISSYPRTHSIFLHSKLSFREGHVLLDAAAPILLRTPLFGMSGWHLEARTHPTWKSQWFYLT